MIFLFAILAFVFTLAGGLIGIKYKHRLDLIFGFTAGILLSLIALELFPEMIELIEATGINPMYPMGALLIGFLLFHVIEKVMHLHHAGEENYKEHNHMNLGVFSALTLALHSFIDGVGIGAGFQVSTALGVVISIAVLSHDFADGLNTASFMILHKNSTKKTLLLILIDAVAPILGIVSTIFFTISDSAVLIYLGFFSGFLLYIATSEILPEAHSKSKSLKPLLMTLLGVIFIGLTVVLGGH